MRWNYTKGKRKGLTLELNTFQHYMKVLFAVFTKQELEFNFRNDFNATGEYHGVIPGVWNEQKKLEPSFGTLANRTQFDKDANTKVCLAHKNNLFDPFVPVKNAKDYTDIVRLMVFIMGRYFLYRDRSEIAQITWYINLH